MADEPTISADLFREMLKGAIAEAVAPLKQSIETLQADNLRLQGELTKSNEERFAAANLPRHLMGTSDPSLGAVSDDRFASRVTIATRPVIDNPEQYAHIVDTGALTKNSKSTPMAEEE